MNNFLSTLETNTHLSLEQLAIGYGEYGLSFGADLSCEVPSLAGLLESLGLTVPNNGKALAATEVAISLGYEHSRDSPGTTAYSTVAKVTITGPLQLGAIFAVKDFPVSFIPAIDKIELSFSLEKSTISLGAQSSANTQSEEVDFQLSFRSGPQAVPNILVGTYQSYTQNNAKISGLAGTLHTAGSSWSSFGFAKDFPLDIAVQQPFVVHGSCAMTGHETAASTFTIVGANIDMGVGAGFPKAPVIDQFLKASQLAFNDLNLVYASSTPTPADILIANGLLKTVGLPALQVSPFTMGISAIPSTLISKGINIQGSATLQAHMNVGDWIASWPTGYVPAGALKDIATVFPPLTITDINFGYHQGNHGMQLGAKAQLVVKRETLPFELRAACEKNNKGTSAWVITGGSNFSQPMTLTHIFDEVLNSFGITQDSIPTSITDLGVSITSLSLSYNTSTKDFEFTFTLDQPAPFSGVTGGDISTDSSSPHSFNSFSLSRLTTGSSTITQLKITIAAGLQLVELLDLQGDLPAGFNPTLDAIDFSVLLGKTTQGKETAQSNAFRFSTTFTYKGHQFEFNGAHSKVTSGTFTNALFGGTIFSPDGGTIDMGSTFPVNIDLKDLFIAKISVTEGTESPVNFSIFGTDLSVGANIDLGSLAVIGGFLSDAKFKFEALRITYSKAIMSATELTIVNNFLTELEVPPLLIAQSTMTGTAASTLDFPSGYSLQGTLILGDNEEVIPLYTSFSQMPSTSTLSKGAIVSMPSGNQNQGSTLNYNSTYPTTATPIAKKYGPVILQSIGLGARNGGVGLKFTGGLAIGPVAFELIGFEITSPIKHFNPDITIEGLALDIAKPPLFVQGLMLKENINIPQLNTVTGQVDMETLTGYTGSLSMQYQQYGLDILGSYAQLPDGSASMFMYGFLGAPLGGPPFLYISGVAAGFGYNRTFNLPPPTAISQFPLIQPVIGTMPQGTMADNFAAMNKDFLPKEGAFWGAVGLRIESFNMIECFALLDVQFNEGIEIDLMGICNMSFPVQQDSEDTLPLARVLLGLEGRILPEQGIISMSGGIQAGTYFLDPAVHITGGFGMLNILRAQSSGTYIGAKEGTFTFSIGGYPQHYPVPHYYPQLQRMQLSWQFSSMLSIKGSAYFAIVPEAMLAGGALESIFQIGGPLDINASFVLGADLVIQWKPFHYTADVVLEIDVSAKINIDCWLFSVHLDFNMDLGAELQVWGPPFAGKGFLTVHTIISFSVDVSFGDAMPAPVPISWAEFQSSFLPASANILTSSVSHGLIHKVEQTTGNTTTTIAVVNPKTMSISCQTAFPLKSITDSKSNSLANPSNVSFGIAPMAKTTTDVQSSLIISISKNGQSVEDDFEYTIVNRNLPSAMWQAADTEGTSPDTKGKSLISDLACGIEITPQSKEIENPCTIAEPGEEIILTPSAPSIASFTYSSADFSIIKT